MKVVCITGAMSGVGKTTLAENLLSRLHNWAACKVTACAGGKKHRCPRGKDESCGVCTTIEENYVIEENAEVINAKGKDTGRLVSAGAGKVLWVKSLPPYLSIAIQEAIQKLQEYDGIVFEGNNALKHVDPDLAVMVLSRDGRYKKSARDIIDKIDMFFDWKDEDELIDRVIERIGACTAEESRGVSSFTNAKDSV